MKLVPYYDRTELVKDAIHTVTKALEEGAVFVLVVLIVLLADLRSALIVTLILPLAALFAFIMMRWWGLTANLMSLGGLAIGIGMMVDGAVVMVENIHRHLTEKTDPAQHHQRNKIETVLLLRQRSGAPDRLRHFHYHHRLSPALHLQGFEGKMFSPLAFTISFALLGSLILSLTVVPMLCTFFLKQKPHEHDPWHIKRLKPIYLVALKPCVRHPWRTVLPAVGVLLGSLLLCRCSALNFCPRPMRARWQSGSRDCRASRSKNRSISKPGSKRS